MAGLASPPAEVGEVALGPDEPYGVAAPWSELDEGERARRRYSAVVGWSCWWSEEYWDWFGVRGKPGEATGEEAALLARTWWSE